MVCQFAPQLLPACTLLMLATMVPLLVVALLFLFSVR
jgi:hypothetical protein